MAMSQDHKDALAEGRRQARAIKAYMKAVQGRKRGRPTSKKAVESRIEKLNEQIGNAEDLKKVELIQARLDLEGQLARLEETEDTEALEAGFVEHAAAYSERKGISYTAWREVGVPAAVLRSAGVKETRRRN